MGRAPFFVKAKKRREDTDVPQDCCTAVLLSSAKNLCFRANFRLQGD